MRKMFIKYLVAVMTCAMICIIATSTRITDKLTEKYTNQEARNTISQILSKLQSSETEIEETKRMLQEDYITRCKAFRYIAEKDPGLFTDSDELSRITEFLSVDELNIIDETGIILISSNPEHTGYDMKSAEQSIEFMKLFLGLKTEITQDILPRGVDEIDFQYVGVISSDGKYVFQVGMKPERYLYALERSSLTGFISKNAITNEENYVFIVDVQTGKYLDHSDKSLIGASISENADALKLYEAYKDGGTYNYLGKKYYIYTETTGDKIIGVSYDYRNITALMKDSRIVTVASIILIFILLIIFISMLVDKKIVSPIKRIVTDMNEIANGNMDKNVDEQKLPELKKLSNGINNMKQSIICDSNKISGIISAADIPIAVYDINSATGKCSVTGNFKKLFGLTDSEAVEVFSDNSKLMDFITDVASSLEDGEENIYRVRDKNHWVKIDEMNENGNVFCIVTDATDFILEKKQIQNERDLDALTGINNRRSFEKIVSTLLKNTGSGLESAMLMIDLDDFKSINDTYGHAFGDTYLKYTASFLKTFSDKNIIAGRRSGDEFYMFFHNFHSRKEINANIHALYEFIGDNPIESPSGKIKVKFSSGAAFLDGGKYDFDSLLAKADEMLYKAKRERKGTVISN